MAELSAGAMFYGNTGLGLPFVVTLAAYHLAVDLGITMTQAAGMLQQAPTLVDQFTRASQAQGQAPSNAGNTAPGNPDPNDPKFRNAGASSGETQSVWELNPLRRGQEIERMLGRSPQLSQNFPVIDRFENGVATSIKSIDLGAKSYQSIGRLTSTVRGYANELAAWRGTTWAGTQIDAHQIISRELLLAIPQNATQAQLAALRQLQDWALTIGVIINTTVVP